ncbi:MAG: exodeoxyribonuclease VII small subunit [Candidatus Omnitrophica bacterium CG1_02_49_10]|nr:MAG: exodeoxyribonuclease VII small subunit [Candidatus Omnitrophica bacterium CG1_02_49_10]
MKKSEEIDFEDALKRLEKIVSELESGKLSLDESLKKYEDGKKLSELCTKRLEAAEKRVQILMKESSGPAKLETFSGE